VCSSDLLTTEDVDASVAKKKKKKKK